MVFNLLLADYKRFYPSLLPFLLPFPDSLNILNNSWLLFAIFWKGTDLRVSFALSFALSIHS